MTRKGLPELWADWEDLMLCFALFPGILLSDFIPGLLKHQVKIALVGARPDGRGWLSEDRRAEYKAVQEGDEIDDETDQVKSRIALGPVFLSSGQALLIRPDIVPASYITDLQPCRLLQPRLVASGLRFR